MYPPCYTLNILKPVLPKDLANVLEPWIFKVGVAKSFQHPYCQHNWLDMPCEITLDACTQGNYSGSATSIQIWKKTLRAGIYKLLQHPLCNIQGSEFQFYSPNPTGGLVKWTYFIHLLYAISVELYFLFDTEVCFCIVDNYNIYAHLVFRNRSTTINESQSSHSKDLSISICTTSKYYGQRRS